MCGFSGEVRTDGRRADVAAVERMTAAVERRGPDGTGTFAQDGVALGHRRLKIIDLSVRGAQPMVAPELGLAVVYNGCIYNYRQLRRELEAAGCRFFSDSDTEVLLNAYSAWGERFVDRLQGMFAFAIAERDSGRVILGRDRLGIKPLYLAHAPGRLRFASSLPALLAGGDIDTTIDTVALHHYLSFHAVVPAPATILRGVRKLPPATVLVVEPDGRERTTRYWEPTFERDPQREAWGMQDWSAAIGEALRLAVERRMVADVPVGVLLSGGIDSSVIVGLLAEAGQADLKTFSIGFDDVGRQKGDEFEFSDIVANEFETDHHRIRVPTSRMLPALCDAIELMSEPMVSHDVVAFNLLSEEVSKTIKVVQSGQGADEVFGGYHWYPPMAEAPCPSSGRAANGDDVDAYARAFFDRDDAELRQVVAPEYLADADYSRRFVAEHFATPGAATSVDRALRIDSTVMLVDDPVKRVDNMTMGWGLEARVPFLDHELVELAAACPPELKLADGGKGVLKRAARGVVPDAVIDRPKGYFNVPALRNLEGPFLDLVRTGLNAPEAKERGLFQRDYVARLLAEPNDHLTPMKLNKLWQIALLELWLQTHGI